MLQKRPYDLNDGDLKRAETPGTYSVCKGARSKMLDVREEESKFEETVMEHEKETYDIITINMKGRNYGKGTTDRRRDLIVSFLKRSSASLIFCQEVPAKLKKKVVEKFGSGVYEFAFTDKESAVIWRTSDFDGDRRSVKSTDSSIIKIVERLQRTRSDVDVSEVRTRSAIVKLTSRKTGASFLAVSWHGPWSGKKNTNRLITFNGLICFLREVCEKEELSSFIIGGDFNLDTSEVDGKRYGVTISSDYVLCTWDKKQQLLPPRPGRPFVFYKDTFIASVPSDKYPTTGNIRVFSVKALELEPYQSSENALLDHAPVMGVLELEKLVCTYKKTSIKQERGKLENYFQLCSFVYIIKL